MILSGTDKSYSKLCYAMKLLVHGVFILYMLFAGARVQAQSFNLQLELKFVQNLVSVGKLSEALLAAQNLKTYCWKILYWILKLKKITSETNTFSGKAIMSR